MFSFKSLLSPAWVPALALVLVHCSAKTRPLLPPALPQQTPVQALAPELKPQSETHLHWVRDIQLADGRSECERSSDALNVQNEIAWALDEQARSLPAILNGAKKQPAGTRLETVQMGSVLLVRDRWDAESNTGMTVKKLSWSGLYRDYQKIQDRLDDLRWIELRSNFVRLNHHDRHRLGLDAQVSKGFQKNPGVRRVSPTDWELALDGSDLSTEDRLEFQKAAARYWKSRGHQIVIRWTTRSEMSAAIQVALHPEVGAPSFIDFENRRMQIASGAKSSTVGYFIGKLLGFPDAVQMRWDEKACAYAISYDDGDILSSAESGRALRRHWDALSKFYP